MPVSLNSGANTDVAPRPPSLREQAREALGREFQSDVTHAGPETPAPPHTNMPATITGRSVSGPPVLPRQASISEALGTRDGVVSLPRGSLFQRRGQATPPGGVRTNHYGMPGMASRLTLSMPGARLTGKGYAGPGVGGGLSPAAGSGATVTASVPNASFNFVQTGSQFLASPTGAPVTASVKDGSIGQALMHRYGSPMFRIGTTMAPATGGGGQSRAPAAASGNSGSRSAPITPVSAVA